MQKLTLLLFFLITSYAIRAQERKVIQFKQEKISYQPKNFYVAGIKDDRADTTTIGTVRAGALTKRTVSLNLPGGAAAAIEAYLTSNLSQDTGKVPVIIHLKELEAAEQTGGLKAESEVRATVEFFIKGNKIAEYKGDNSIESGLDATRFVEDLIRRCLGNVIQQFDGWMSSNREQVLAAVNGPAVKVMVECKDTTDDPDKIAWSSRRPLVLADFEAKADDLSRAAAATFSGLDVKFSQERLYGQIKVEVTIIPVFDKTRSWCRLTARSAKTLRHEQMHFNITLISACELAEEIRSHHFTPDNYTGELQQLYRQKEKANQAQQDLYDTETQHGLIVAEQERWEKALNDKLKMYAHTTSEGGKGPVGNL